jgi:hypothetical protein
MKELLAVNKKLVVKTHRTNLKETAKEKLKTGWQVGTLCNIGPSSSVRLK